VSLFEAIGGADTCRKLSTAFYARVDRDPVLRPLFPGTTLRCAIDAFAAFLVQFLGGPSEDSQGRWWVSLDESHRRFRIERQHRDAWMRHMDEALKDVGIAETASAALRNFFEVASAHMIDGKPDSRRMSRELGRRWSAQRAVDAAVAAIRKGNADRAIKLAGGSPPAVLPGLLALMIGSGNGALIEFVHERVTGDPALVHQRYGSRTLLHWAAGAGSLSTVEILLRLGADPNVLDGGKHTPLYCTGNECAGGESAEVVRALVRGGAQVDARDGVTGATALHMAARRGNTVVAKALLDCGADINVRDRRGDTPLQRAINCKKAHVAELLRLWRDVKEYSPQRRRDAEKTKIKVKNGER
jgi:hemoglobin